MLPFFIRSEKYKLSYLYWIIKYIINTKTLIKHFIKR